MKTRILSWLLCLALLLSCCPVLARAADGDFQIEGTVLVKYTGSDSDVAIPEGITVIAANAFHGCYYTLETVTIPDSVLSIGDSAFADCGALSQVRLGRGLLRIGHKAFDCCSKLQEIDIPDSVVYIGPEAFSQCHGLTSVHLPEGLSALAYETFDYCYSLTEIDLPASVRSVGFFAFNKCDSLTRVSMPGVTALGSSVFAYCTALEEVSMPEAVTILDAAFQDCTALKEVNAPHLDLLSTEYSVFRNCEALAEDGFVVVNGVLAEYLGDSSAVTIPAGVTAIGPHAFYNNTSLREVTIPASVTEIAAHAFGFCTNLTRVDLQGRNVKLGAGAFEGCYGLAEDNLIIVGGTLFDYTGSPSHVVIPQGVTAISDLALLRCNMLSVTIPEGVTTIGRAAISQCPRLEEVSLPSTLEYCGDEAFWDDPHLAKDGMIIVGDQLFACYASDTHVTVPEGVTRISGRAFSGNTTMETVTLPGSLREIGDSAFYGCTALRSVTIPDTVESIGQGAFRDCSALTRVTLPSGLTSISGNTFQNCAALTSIRIPDGVETIGSSAFAGCAALSAVQLPEQIAEIEDLAFLDCTALKNLRIPDGIRIIYPNALGYRSGEGWSDPEPREDFTVTASHGTFGEIHALEHGFPLVDAPAPAAGSLDNFVPIQTYENQFLDVTPGAWYYDSVAKAYELGLVKGASDTSYNRKGNIKISETIVLACRIHSIYMDDGETFQQQGSEKYYMPHVRYAIENGIIQEGEYAVYNVPATREQFAAILKKALPEEELQPKNTVQDGAIPDVPMTNAHAAEIYTLYRAGVLTGNDGYGTFHPESNIQRSEVAAIIVRMAVPATRQTVSLP